MSTRCRGRLLGVGAAREAIIGVSRTKCSYVLVARTSITYGGLGRIYGTYRGLGCSLRICTEETAGSETAQDMKFRYGQTSAQRPMAPA
jgi:hypothetical protein